MPSLSRLAAAQTNGVNGHADDDIGAGANAGHRIPVGTARPPLGWTQVSELPRNLRPFGFHKLNFKWHDGWSNSQVTADCPLCYREGKFYVSVETGLWQCKLCA